MAIMRVTCQCGQQLQADQTLAGRKVKCPKCSAPLLVPATTPHLRSPQSTRRTVRSPSYIRSQSDINSTSLDEMVALESRARPRALPTKERKFPSRATSIPCSAPVQKTTKVNVKTDWEKINLGIHIVMVSSLVAIFAPFIVWVPGLGPVGLLVLSLGARIGNVVGLSLCLHVPKKNQAWGFAVAAMVFAGLELIWLLPSTLFFFRYGFASLMGLSLVTSVTAVARVPMFLMFIRKSAQITGQRTEANQALVIMGTYVAVAVGGLVFRTSQVTVLLVQVDPAVTRIVMAIVGVALMGFWIYWSVCYFVFLNELDLGPRRRNSSEQRPDLGSW